LRALSLGKITTGVQIRIDELNMVETYEYNIYPKRRQPLTKRQATNDFSKPWCGWRHLGDK